MVTGKTRLGCLLGSPVAHSISPMMHNEAFRLLGIDNIYMCFDTGGKDLGRIVNSLRDMNVYGFNLTMPDKDRVIPYLDELTDAARMIGAVNTVKNDGGRLIGYNTDGIGYMHAVADAGYDISSGTMTLFGAGGAASAIAVQAALDGAPALHIVQRQGKSWENANRLASVISEQTKCRADVIDMSDDQAVKAAVMESSLLTNATSMGMAPAKLDLTPVNDKSCFHPGLVVSDAIYNPQETRLLREAKEAGCRTFNGMYMLLYQGAAGFEIWTGQKMPVEEIRKKFFSQKQQETEK